MPSRKIKFTSKTDKMFYKLDREKIWEAQNKKCYYCGCEIKRSEITMDHVIPLKKLERRHNLSNCVVACFSCNTKKSDKTKFVHTPNDLDIIIQEALKKIERMTRETEYRMIRALGTEDHKGSFNKWQKYWEKRNRFPHKC